MATVQLSLPDEMSAFLEEEAARQGFATVSDYVRSLILEVRQRQAERLRLDALLIEGLDSGPGTPLTPDDWKCFRAEGRRRISERKRSGR